MEIQVNGRSMPFGQRTLLELLKELQLSERQGVAVAVNDQVIPRTNWNLQELSASDRITVISATAGG